MKNGGDESHQDSNGEDHASIASRKTAKASPPQFPVKRRDGKLVEANSGGGRSRGLHNE